MKKNYFEYVFFNFSNHISTNNTSLEEKQTLLHVPGSANPQSNAGRNDNTVDAIPFNFLKVL